MNMKLFTQLQPNSIFSFIWIILIISLLFLVLSSLPGVPGRDSSAFIYMAEGILNGELPYLDRWDHKPPLIYLLDLVGLALSGGDFWGIWLLETLFLVSSLGLAYLVLKENFGTTSAFFSISIFLIYFNKLIEGGNLTEEYALLFQFFALYLFLQIEKQPDTRPLLPFIIGTLSAGAFLLKPNLVGLWLAIGLYWIFWTRHAAFYILWAVLGASFIFLTLFITLYSFDAWSAFLDATFSYNFAYSSGTTFKEKVAAGKAISKLFDEVFPLIIISWLIGLIYFLVRKTKNEVFDGLLRVALILLPIEALLVSTSGRIFAHYYLVALPAITILIAYFGVIVNKTVLMLSKKWTISKRNENHVKTITVVLLFVFFINTLYPYRDNYTAKVSHIKQYINDEKPKQDNLLNIAKHIREKISPDEYILVWGAQAQIYLFSQRQASSRYYYQYPLFMPNYTNRSIVDVFFTEFNENKPALIIETKNKWLPPLNKKKRLAWQPVNKLRYNYSENLFQPFFKSLETEYKFTEELHGYNIYKRID